MISALAAETGFTKRDSAKALNGVLRVITDALTSGEEVRIVGFGVFRVREHMSRRGRNPGTGAPVEIPSGVHPVFLAGKSLKDAVNARGPQND